MNPRDLLTPAALHILLSLANEPQHGYAIKAEIEERTGGRLSLGPGTLYEAIHRMHRDGWIVELEARGRRRVYGITADGREVLDAELRRLDEIVDFARASSLFPAGDGHDRVPLSSGQPPPPARLVRTSAPLWLRALLRLYPADFRESRRAEIEDFVEQEFADARWPRPLVGLRIATDLVRASLHIRFRGPSARAGLGEPTADHDTGRRSPGSALGWEVRSALRGVLRHRALSATVILTLGTGIGANVALFSLVENVLLKPLPYPEADRLVRIWEHNPEVSDEPLGPSPLNAADWAERVERFESLTAWYLTSGTFRGAFGAEEIRSAQVTSDFFRVLGVQPALGRDFVPGEVVRYGPVILSHAAWRRMFGADADVIGRTVEISGDAYEIVGVMPRSFAFPDPSIEAWLAWDLKAVYVDRPETRTWRFMDALGRMAPGVDLAEAEEDLARVAEALSAEHPTENAGWGVTVAGLHDVVVGEARGTLWVAFGAVVFTLLIACANVANLLLARVPTLARDLAVRLTLGATRGRIARQLLLENLLLATAAAGLGLLVGQGLLNALVALDAGRVPRLEEVRIDLMALGFASMVATLTALIFGLVPAAQAMKAASVESLRAGKRTTGGVPQRRPRELFVASQIAVAVVLVSGAWLFSSSLAALARVDLGFDPAQVTTLRVSLDPVGGGPQQVVTYYDDLVDHLESLPGVLGVGLSQTLPLNPVGNDFRRPFRSAGSGLSAADAPSVQMRIVSPGYPTVLRMHFLEGGTIPTDAQAGEPLVAVINESLARRLWPDGPRVGRSFEIDFRGGWERYTVLGVVQDLKHYGPRGGPTPEVFLSHRQIPYLAMSAAVRTDGSTAADEQVLRAAVAELVPQQPAHDFVTLEELAEASVADDRFLSVLLSVLAAIALLLASTGVYGVIAFGVSHRRHEIGVRMALGADPVSVAGSIIRDTAVMALVGVAVGTLLTLAGRSLIEGLLFGALPGAGRTALGVVGLLMAVACAAAYLPARSAAGIAPSEALQAD